MRTIVINRDEHLGRFRNTATQFLQRGKILMYLSAVRGETVTASPRYGKNAYACLLSHLLVQELMKDSSSDWILVAEDDICLLGDGVSESLLETAPADATLLQLTTLTGRHYAEQIEDVCELWTPVRNGYYGTQLYAFKPSAVRDLFANAGVDDVLSFRHKMLPDIPDALEVADSYTYCLHKTYLCAYPFAYSDINLGSTLHPEHLDMHEQGWKEVRSHFNRFKNPYLVTG